MSEYEQMKDPRVLRGGCGAANQISRTGLPNIEQAQQCASSSAHGSARDLIDTLIEYHNRSAQELHDLLRGLPREMNRGAEEALYRFASAELTRVRRP